MRGDTGAVARDRSRWIDARAGAAGWTGLAAGISRVPLTDAPVAFIGIARDEENGTAGPVLHTISCGDAVLRRHHN